MPSTKTRKSVGNAQPRPDSTPVVEETPLGFFEKFYAPHENPNWKQLDARGLAQIILDADQRRAEFQKQMAASSLPSEEEFQASRQRPSRKKRPRPPLNRAGGKKSPRDRASRLSLLAELFADAPRGKKAAGDLDVLIKKLYDEDPVSKGKASRRAEQPILAIHSDAGPDSSFVSGHAWLSYTDADGNVTNYGLWPDSNKKVPDNGPGGDVRIGVEDGRAPLYSRYYRLTPEQVARWNEFRKRDDTWRFTHTCAEWASDGIRHVIGEDVDADDWLGFETPRKISKSILELQNPQLKSPSQPLPPQHRRSSSW